MGSKSSPPPAPDYAGAARAQSAGSLQSALANNMMAHPNVHSPLGSQTWQQTGTQTIPGAEGNPSVDIPTYDQNISLSPGGQNLFDKQMDLSTGLLGLGQGSLNQVQNSLGKPQDMNSVNDIANQAYQAQTSRLDPQWQHAGEMENTQLVNQGLRPGGEAYDNSMRVFNQGKNDAYQQARMAAISTMPQTYQMSTAQRMQPLSEFNAIRTGSQPQMPQFQPVQFPGSMQGPQNMQAAGQAGQYAGNIYSNQMAQQNAMMSGLFGLGSAAILA